MRLAPIALFTFKRLEHTKATIESLKGNLLAEQSDLFVFADGPRNENEKIETDKVRSFLRGIEGFQSVKIIERDQNHGLAKSIISGVTELVEEFGKVIVVEDDLVTRENFLTFMNEALTRYQNDDKVGCIHGYVYPLLTSMEKPFFLKGADCWGWATWKRAWQLFEADGSALLSAIEARNLGTIFDFENSYPYTQMLRDQISGKNNSWAIRWSASLFLENKLCLYPNFSLVSNIGFDGTGTHCNVNQAYSKDAKTLKNDKSISLENLEVSHSEEGYRRFRTIFDQHFRSVHFLERLEAGFQVTYKISENLNCKMDPEKM